MTSTNERRPGVGSQAAQAFDGAVLSLAELDDKAAHLNGAFVVLVEITGEPARYRRRPYLTAAAAEHAAHNALKRGQNARVYLAELRPLYRLEGIQ